MVESFRLETIGEIHPVATQLFVPFAVTRLQQRPEETEAVLAVALHGIGEQANPYGTDGYVVVVGFAARKVNFSFHRNDRGAL